MGVIMGVSEDEGSTQCVISFQYQISKSVGFKVSIPFWNEVIYIKFQINFL